jgi:hypothetical protein
MSGRKDNFIAGVSYDIICLGILWLVQHGFLIRSIKNQPIKKKCQLRKREWSLNIPFSLPVRSAFPTIVLNPKGEECRIRQPSLQIHEWHFIKAQSDIKRALKAIPKVAYDIEHID